MPEPDSWQELVDMIARQRSELKSAHDTLEAVTRERDRLRRDVRELEERVEKLRWIG